MDTVSFPAIAKNFAFNFVKQLMIKLLRVIALDRNSETVRVHIVDHYVIIFAQYAHDLGPLAFLAINPVVFHSLMILCLFYASFGQCVNFYSLHGAPATGFRGETVARVCRSGGYGLANGAGRSTGCLIPWLQIKQLSPAGPVVAGYHQRKIQGSPIPLIVHKGGLPRSLIFKSVSVRCFFDVLENRLSVPGRFGKSTPV